MNLGTIIGAAIAAAGLAACGSTVIAPTARPTVAQTIAPTATPPTSPAATATATPTPTASGCMPQTAGVECPALTVASCDDSLVNAHNDGGSVSYTVASADDQLVIEPGAITVNSTGTSGTYGPLSKGAYTYQFRTSDGSDIAGDGASGSFTIPSCPPAASWGFTTTCANPGTAQGGSLIITFSSGTPDTVVIDGNTVPVTSNPFTSGPFDVGDHTVVLEGFNGSFKIAAC